MHASMLNPRRMHSLPLRFGPRVCIRKRQISMKALRLLRHATNGMMLVGAFLSMASTSKGKCLQKKWYDGTNAFLFMDTMAAL
jgi:EAL domain-containing protein (putative c-di-GMP-specific phosphodiesterase class I)